MGEVFYQGPDEDRYRCVVLTRSVGNTAVEGIRSPRRRSENDSSSTSSRSTFRPVKQLRAYSENITRTSRMEQKLVDRNR